MLNLTKQLLKILVGLCMIGVLLVVGIFTLLDPNQFKDLIRKQVAQNTGRILTLNGPLFWHLDPHLSLEAFDVSLSNAPSFPNEFASFKKAKVAADLWSLFSGKLLVNIELDGGKLNLARQSSGLTNWQDLQGVLQLSVNQYKNLPLMPYNFKIKNTEINWQDHEHKKNIRIKELNFTAEKIAMGIAGFSSPILMNFKMENQVNHHYGSFSLNAEWYRNDKQKQFEIHGLEAKANLQELSPTIVIGDLKVQDLALQTVQGKLRIQNPNLTQWLAEFNLPTSPHLASISDLSGNFQFQYPSLDVANLLLSFEDQGLLEGNFKANVTGNSLQMLHSTGNFHGKSILLGKLPIKEFKTKFESNEGIFNFDQIYADLANSQHQGQLKVDLRSNIPQYALSDQINSFEINDLLTLFGEKDKLHGRIQATTTLFTHGTNLEECMQNLSGEGHISLTDGKLGGIELPILLQHAQSTITTLSDSLKNQEPINISAILTAELGEWKHQAINNQLLATPFRLIETAITVDSGKLQTSNFKLIHPEFTVSGQGSLDLFRKSVEYQASALLSRPSQLNSDDLAIFLKDTPLAIQIQGPLNDLSVRPDLARYADGALKLIKDKSKQPDGFEKLTEPDKNDNALEKLFGFQ